jgi:hypothetical protein
MPRNSFVGLAASVREALATPQNFVASSSEDKEALLDLIEPISEPNVTLSGDTESLCGLSCSVSSTFAFGSNCESDLPRLLRYFQIPIAAVNC